MIAGYGKHGYQIEVRTTPPLPSVQGDTDSLKQCLVNTVKNSIEAMPDGGLILIELGMGDNEVIIRIIDTGTGMDENQMDRAFNPFYSTKEGGSGLGLPMIKKIIEECGGSVSLASKPGKGTTVTIRLQPAFDSEQSAQIEPAEQQ
jgi:signal transduction histidine kinase